MSVLDIPSVREAAETQFEQIDNAAASHGVAVDPIAREIVALIATSEFFEPVSSEDELRERGARRPPDFDEREFDFVFHGALHELIHESDAIQYDETIHVVTTRDVWHWISRHGTRMGQALLPGRKGDD